MLDLDTLKDGMFNVAKSFSFRHGMQDNLIRTLHDIAEVDNVSPLADVYEKQIGDLTKQLDKTTDEKDKKAIQDKIKSITLPSNTPLVNRKKTSN